MRSMLMQDWNIADPVNPDNPRNIAVILDLCVCGCACVCVCMVREKIVICTKVNTKLVQFVIKLIWS